MLHANLIYRYRDVRFGAVSQLSQAASIMHSESRLVIPTSSCNCERKRPANRSRLYVAVAHSQQQHACMMQIFKQPYPQYTTFSRRSDQNHLLKASSDQVPGANVQLAPSCLQVLVCQVKLTRKVQQREEMEEKEPNQKLVCLTSLCLNGSCCAQNREQGTCRREDSPYSLLRPACCLLSFLSCSFSDRRSPLQEQRSLQAVLDSYSLDLSKVFHHIGRATHVETKPRARFLKL